MTDTDDVVCDFCELPADECECCYDCGDYPCQCDEDEVDD